MTPCRADFAARSLAPALGTARERNSAQLAPRHALGRFLPRFMLSISATVSAGYMSKGMSPFILARV